MRKRPAVAMGVAVLAALTCAAYGQVAASAAPASGAPVPGAAITRAVSATSASTQWRARTVLTEPLALAISNQLIDAHAGVDFALSSVGHGSTYRLRRIPLSRGPVLVAGRTFPVNEISLGAGSVWLFGARPAAHSAVSLVLYQINPATLAVIRSWTLSPGEHRSGFVAVAPGAGGTVWVGFLRTILRINASSGAIVDRIRIGSGLTVSDVTVDPAGRHLYVAANTSLSGTAVAEYNAVTGRRIASSARGDLRFSVGGASITAVPGGAWVSFRTGMLGETVLLAQSGLRMVKLPGAGKPGSLFGWVMFASTEYAGKALFLARADGVIGCMNPQTGRVRDRGKVSKLVNFGQLIGATRSGNVLYGLSQAGVVAITPPAACQV